MAGRQCFVRWVDEGFDLGHFGSRFDAAYASLTDGARDLESCGFFLEQPEGWGYFHGKPSGTRARDASMSADGHTAMKIEHMKQSDDANFMFKFSWLETAHQRGWVIHYRPKHLPLSSELGSVFEFLGLKQFESCPEFDFDDCYWRSIGFVSRGDSPFDTNAQAAHQWFYAHSSRFSAGVEKLLSANAMIEETGLRFLPFAKPAERLAVDIEKKVQRPRDRRQNKELEFDVAISFAGAQRERAEELATLVRGAGFSVFYDGFYPEQLWGKNLADYFDDVFRKRGGKHCVIFVSKEYKESSWTDHERRSAQARALYEKGGEYLLPIKVDDTELDGMRRCPAEC